MAHPSSVNEKNTTQIPSHFFDQIFLRVYMPEKNLRAIDSPKGQPNWLQPNTQKVADTGVVSSLRKMHNF